MNHSIASIIDHSLLHPALTDDEMHAGCRLAVEYRVASVCIKPCAVEQAARWLAGSNVKVGTVIGFPHGAHCTEIKVAESARACRDGAVELDVVVNVGKVLSGEWAYVEADVAAVVDMAHAQGAIIKVIFENDLLTSDEQKIRLCGICEHAGAEYVKTSTGFGFVKGTDGRYSYRGATEHDVRLMRANVASRVGVKAAGGIRTYQQAIRFRELGATRLGTTSTEAIVAEERGAADR